MLCYKLVCNPCIAQNIEKKERKFRKCTRWLFLVSKIFFFFHRK
jgi:hypothetical protein